MERYETEEQQVEAIKRFWKENGSALVIGAVLGLSGLYGWRYYNDSKIAGQEAASATFEQAEKDLLKDEKGFGAAQAYISEHGDTGYAYLMALQLAQQAIERKDLNEAGKQLAFVAEHAEMSAVKAIAGLRLARVQLEQGQFEQALQNLDKISDEAFQGQSHEVKGDIYVAQQLFDKARAAYSAALEKNTSDRVLKMKLDSLASMTVAAANG